MTRESILSHDGVPAAQTQIGSGQVLIQRIRLLSAMAVAGIIFWHFGWWVARPDDPGGAVSMLMIDNGVIAMAELLGLAVVVSGLAVAICGAGSAERGPFAVAVGLATLGLRGAQMDKLILHRMTSTDPNIAAHPYPVFEFIAETWLWLALIGVGFVVGRWVESWFDPQREPPTPQRRAIDHAMDIRQGVGTVAVAFFVAWVMVSFVAGNETMPLLKGQLYFALIAAFLFASLIAHWFFQMKTRTWALVSIAIVATVAYLYGQPSTKVLEEARVIGAYVPLSSVARPLPIEYAAMGGIGVLFEADVMAFFFAVFGLSPSDRETGDVV